MKKILNSSFIQEISNLPEDQKELIYRWCQQALEISNNKSLTAVQKIQKFQKLETIPFIKIIHERTLKQIKAKLWEERGWPARFALGGLAIGATLASRRLLTLASIGATVSSRAYFLTTTGIRVLKTLADELKKNREVEENSLR